MKRSVADRSPVDHMFSTKQTFKLENYLRNSVSAVLRKININDRIKNVIKNVFCTAVGFLYK